MQQSSPMPPPAPHSDDLQGVSQQSEAPQSDSLLPGTELLSVALRGQFELADGHHISGWAADFACPDEPVRLLIKAGNQILGEGLADLYRENLKDAGIGNGSHGFSIPIVVPFESGTTLELTMVEASTGVPVDAEHFNVICRNPDFFDDIELDRKSVYSTAPTSKSSREKPRRKLSPIEKKITRPYRIIRKKIRRFMPVSTQTVIAQPVTTPLNKSIHAGLVAGQAIANEWPSLVLPVADKPTMSVIIPVHNQFRLTYQCLASIILAADQTEFEVILIDDCSTDETIHIESCVANLVTIRNEKNMGFLHSCNKAAVQARGDYIVFLNNDTMVSKSWLDELYGTFNRFDHVGAVGAKLVYPDGRLQDAGGIVWDSCVPWNVGHGQDPEDPQYNYVRDVDYLTGAALAVSRSAWQQVGGFSKEYAPAYYEDTDLAFKLRAAGYRTLYCPQASIVHFEGQSNGTSLESGIKQYQRVNASRFVSTWKHTVVGNGAEGVDLHLQKDRNHTLRVLMIDNAFPRVGQDAGSYAAMQEIRLMQTMGCKITFLPYNLLHLGVHVEELQRHGVECIYSPHQQSIDGFLKNRGNEFDAIYITRYTVAENVLGLIRKYSNAKILFNNADLHFLREMRGALVRGESDLSDAMQTRKRELAVMNSVDAVLSYNETEHHIIASHLMRDDHVFKCPWLLEKKTPIVPFEQRTGIAFLGGFAHPPNREAMDWFIQHVLPILEARDPTIRLHIWGSRIPADSSWHSDERVVVEGYADSLDQIFNQCRVFVAPLRSGAGIKGKVLDSVAYAVPAVLSPVAAEATGLIDGVSTLIANSPEQWVTHICRLHEDQGMWQAFSTETHNLLDKEYGFDVGLHRMRTVFASLGLLENNTVEVNQRAA